MNDIINVADFCHVMRNFPFVQSKFTYFLLLQQYILKFTVLILYNLEISLWTCLHVSLNLNIFVRYIIPTSGAISGLYLENLIFTVFLFFSFYNNVFLNYVRTLYNLNVKFTPCIWIVNFAYQYLRTFKISNFV